MIQALRSSTVRLDQMLVVENQARTKVKNITKVIECPWPYGTLYRETWIIVVVKSIPRLLAKTLNVT